MPMTSRVLLLGLVAAASSLEAAPVATAGPLPAAFAAPRLDPAPALVGDRWYREYDDDDDYYYPPEYYLPPPVVRVVPVPPPVEVYEPPVYGWITPPRPSSCGKYRYWTGESCADARYDPPYVGPRW